MSLNPNAVDPPAESAPEETGLEDVTARIMALPGLKRRDIKKCAVCGKGVAHDGGLTFYRLKIERFVFDGRAINRRAGLEAYFGGGGGGAMLAEAMGTDDYLAKACMLPLDVLVCDPCTEGRFLVQRIVEVQP